MLKRFWNHVLELGLTLWVLRAPVVALLFGFLILYAAPQAQDLLVDVAAGPWWYIVSLLLATLLVWAGTTHYASRLLLSTDARFLERVGGREDSFIGRLQKWTPRVLGAVPFAEMLVGVGRSYNNVPAVSDGATEAAKFSLKLLAVYLVCTLLVYGLYVIFRQRLAAGRLITSIERAVEALLAPLAKRLPTALALGQHSGGENKLGYLGPVVLMLMFFFFTFLPFFDPFRFADWFPRALAVPFIFAGWVPLAAYVSGVGRHLRVPIITFAFIAAWSLAAIFGDTYIMRDRPAPMPAGDLAKLSKPAAPGDATVTPAGVAAAATTALGLGLKDAVDLWKRANCAPQPTGCPRPIIIAASGGASRAGFFTASVIGHLLDAGAKLLGSDKVGPEGVRNRIFAISSVSGSSVGAVMSVAALAATDGEQPCHSGPFTLWHGTTVKGWRDCLEVLTSGDFLTSAFAGLIFRDTMRFWGRKWRDRAALIEESWEKHFERSIKAKLGASKMLTCIGSLECPFLTLRPTEEGRGGKVNWLPLLLLNGASVSTGQRIVTTLLDPWYRVDNGDQCPLALAVDKDMQCPILDHTYDVHWLMGNGGAAKGYGKDVRLSTAAHNSARFPIVSPPGEIYRGEKIIDRIVDGGYFENFGAQTAVELARAMQAIDPKLAPFILIVSNDPGIPLSDKLQDPDEDTGSFITDLSGPVKAIMNSRTARGTLASDGVSRALTAMLTGECGPKNSAHIRVWPEFLDDKQTKVRELSFSWWLSKPVQQRLNQQTKFSDPKKHDNQDAQQVVALALTSKVPETCGARGLPKPDPRN
jgi:hypothetical protein